jgi:hypothetical protein
MCEEVAHRVPTGNVARRAPVMKSRLDLSAFHMDIFVHVGDEDQR